MRVPGGTFGGLSVGALNEARARRVRRIHFAESVDHFELRLGSGACGARTHREAGYDEPCEPAMKDSHMEAYDTFSEFLSATAFASCLALSCCAEVAKPAHGYAGT